MRQQNEVGIAYRCFPAGAQWRDCLASFYAGCNGLARN